MKCVKLDKDQLKLLSLVPGIHWFCPSCNSFGNDRFFESKYCDILKKVEKSAESTVNTYRDIWEKKQEEFVVQSEKCTKNVVRLHEKLDESIDKMKGVLSSKLLLKVEETVESSAEQNRELIRTCDEIFVQTTKSSNDIVNLHKKLDEKITDMKEALSVINTKPVNEESIHIPSMQKNSDPNPNTHNLVVYNIPITVNDSPAAHHLASICGVIKSRIVGVKRLGSRHLEKPPLLISCDSAQTKRRFINLINDCRFRGTYARPQLNPEELKKDQQLVRNLRDSRKLNPQKVLKIHRGKIVEEIENHYVEFSAVNNNIESHNG